MAIAQQRVTAEELLRLPDDGYRHELIAGELRTMSPSGGQHGQIAARVIELLGPYVRSHKLGRLFGAETGFILSRNPDTVRAPDAAFMRRERADEIGDEEGYVPGAPDLAVEVISPNDLYAEVEEKVADWLEHGTRMVLVINPRRRRQTVAVHHPGEPVRVLREGDMLDGGDVLPGWRLPVRELFAADAS